MDLPLSDVNGLLELFPFNAEGTAVLSAVLPAVLAAVVAVLFTVVSVAEASEFVVWPVLVAVAVVACSVPVVAVVVAAMAVVVEASSRLAGTSTPAVTRFRHSSSCSKPHIQRLFRHIVFQFRLS